VHLAARHRYAVTVEDAVRLGGVGTALAQACTDAGVSTPVRNLGLPPAFLPHDTRAALLSTHRLDAEGIVHTVTDLLDTPAAVARSRRLEGTPT
jgi:1-deoxy-D-xylulose-5-phosphate synthase